MNHSDHKGNGSILEKSVKKEISWNYKLGGRFLDILIKIIL